MTRVFISYRRNDSQHVSARIADRLKMGERYTVFFDTESIQPGEDFPTRLVRELLESDCALVVIGPEWLDATFTEGPGTGQRRLDDPNDYVRNEVRVALSRGHAFPVVPLLLDDTPVPEEGELPTDIAELSKRHCLSIRWSDFDRDLEDLMGLLDTFADHGPGPEEASLPAALDIDPLQLTLRLIPSGQFLMGSPDELGAAYLDEKPLHRVEIPQAFYLGEAPVTVGQFHQLTGLLEVKGNQSSPAVGVNWTMAAAFCNQLSAQQGLPLYYEMAENGSIEIQGGNGFRLPTEAEWEYACRARTSTTWSCGENKNLLDAIAWFRDNSGGEPRPVCQKEANPWGLYDMHGNVWEWCNDWYSSTNYSHSPVVSPYGPTEGCARVIRGGAFDCQADHIRSAFRDSSRPWTRKKTIGFRIARSL